MTLIGKNKFYIGQPNPTQQNLPTFTVGENIFKMEKKQLKKHIYGTFDYKTKIK